MRWAIVLAVLLGIFVWTVEGITTIAVKRAYCYDCYYGTCYTSAICGGPGCVCIKTSWGKGQCAKIER